MDGGTTRVGPGRGRGERLTEGLTVAVSAALALVLLAGPVIVFSMSSWHSATEPGTTAFSRFVAPVVLLSLVALPFVSAGVVFRSGRRKNKERLGAAVPAALTLLGSSVVPLAAFCLLLVYAN
ncbi:hypothetical protein [Streptomyces mutabilis]|uniref:hypothetical protein n=1 Tax=Streptomyces mutabilis TaxID=67332 RepID=UPI0036AD0A39